MVIQRFVVGVVGMIFDQDGRILGLRRSANNQHWAGAWECVSGKMEPGEAPYQAIRREIKEECVIEVKIDPRPIDCVMAEHGSDPLLLILFRCRYKGGSIQLSSEHDEYGWFSVEEFSERTPFKQLPRLARMWGMQDING